MIKRFVLLTIAGLGIGINACLPALGLDRVEYEALIEKDSITIDESVQYLVVVRYPLTTVKPAITPPTFAQFTILNDYESIKEEITDHDRYRVYRKVWLLKPSESGQLSIASTIITYQDPTSNLLENGKTDIVFIEVEPRTNQPASTPASASKSVTTSEATSDGQSAWFWPAVGSLVMVGIAVLVILIMKRPTDVYQAEHKAQAALQQAIGFAEQEKLEQYHQQLSRALLDYLQDKFGIDAHVLATEQILSQLNHLGIATKVIDDLSYYFKAADQAKFGGYNPDEDEIIKLHGIVNQVIEIGKTVKVKKR